MLASISPSDSVAISAPPGSGQQPRHPSPSTAAAGAGAEAPGAPAGAAARRGARGVMLHSQVGECVGGGGRLSGEEVPHPLDAQVLSLEHPFPLLSGPPQRHPLCTFVLFMRPTLVA